MQFRGFAVAALALAIARPSLAQNFAFSKVEQPTKGQPYVQGDLNGDGLSDLLNTGSNNQSNGFYAVLSNASGTYQPPVFYAPRYPGNQNVLAVGDFNGDGRVDVADVAGTPDYYIFLNSGGGQFFPSWNFGTKPAKNYEVATADFNRDGKLDLVLLNDSGLQLFYGTGKGTFSRAFTIDAHPAGGLILIGDFDSDGFADVATTAGQCTSDVGCNTQIRVYYGDGKGNFSTPTAIDYPSDDYYFRVSSDVYQDGHSDLVGVCGDTCQFSNPAQGVVRILHGTTNRSFITQDIYLPSGEFPYIFSPVAVADFDGDGIKDLAVSVTNSTNSSIAVFPGELNGAFGTEQYVYTDSVHPIVGLTVGRYDGDTKPDLTAYYQIDSVNSQLEIFHNTSTGSAFPGCAPPAAPRGISACGPQNGSTVRSPVQFHVGADFTSPLRKTEVWIDGKKVDESFNSYSTYSFLDGSFSLATGSHRADIYSASFDNLLQKKTIMFTVK